MLVGFRMMDARGPGGARPRVLVAGSYLVALVMHVERFPAIGETVHGGGFFETHGGKGSNMAVQATRLGAEVSYAGVVGDDPRGHLFRELLDGEGIHAAHLHVDGAVATGVGFILLGADGQNMIAIDSGANAQFTAEQAAAAVAATMGRSNPGESAGAVLTQLEIPLATALAAMRAGARHGCRTILNPAPAQDLTAHDLTAVSVITPNETEARVCLGLDPRQTADERELGERLLERGCGAALLTLGERGCLAVTAAGAVRVPGFAVDEVIDTTGAGDAFNAGLAVGLAEGMQLYDAARLANAAAALCCTRLTTLDSYQGRAAVAKLLVTAVGG